VEEELKFRNFFVFEFGSFTRKSSSVSIKGTAFSWRQPGIPLSAGRSDPLSEKD
jgi:hypothetical protein